ncbi:MAG: dipeptidase PepE [Acidobacteriota bacterium]|nr:dipeptidase PepE [Acidobacteriota bacterium]
MKRLLLISSSRVHGTAFLDHAEAAIRDTFAGSQRVLFVPYALADRDAYARQAAARLAEMGFESESLHICSDPVRSVESAPAIFVGGGNTFRLLKSLQDRGLVEAIRRRVEASIPYVGSSAGSIVAGPTLMTTKDMPIVQPLSFDALGLVPFQISPHYLDPDPTSTYMGETQEERINQYLEENERPVVGLREGSMLSIVAGSVRLEGTAGARVFRRGYEPVETLPGADLGPLLLPQTAAVS